MSDSAAKPHRRMPWRLALLVPAAAYLAIWRGIPGVTPMLTFTWITGLLTGGALVAAGMWGPALLTAAAHAQKEGAARRKAKAQKAAIKAKAAAESHR
ncbi:hypothetical protein GTY67_34390 [Streptomyces sp. SID8374]|uniref:hypothetical protein n=1 Tax=Streptomyces sp. SID8374 TaxID=2690354 RepID=UPI00136E5274|nr:hypothetical protein [Streptomyces sp. SID8374]MYX18440.1 hypothetical protein [Streptomyces sp. SID8374]